MFLPAEDQLARIRAAALEVIPEPELLTKLKKSRETNRPLVIKQGFDPTRPDLHIGHAVSLRVLRIFQELGHDVVFVVGDYTARVGDPSGRSETRPRLSTEEIEANARTYADQVGQILDLEKVRLEYNSKWLAPLDLERLLELLATYTVARMLERDDFAKRFADERPISLLEFLYPLMQAYDSVALRADVEVGGTDQKFNLLVGRTVQERYGQDPQVCLVMPLLRGTDGVRKMSKSYDNYVAITEPPEEQFGKTMSIPDDLLDEWTRYATDLETDQLDAALRQAADDPYAAKRSLARRIVTLHHGDVAAERAEAHFDQLFRKRETPDDVPEVDVALEDESLRYDPATGAWAPALLVAAGLAASNGEASRLIDQGAISVDGEKLNGPGREARVAIAPGEARVIQRGRRRFAAVRAS